MRKLLIEPFPHTVTVETNQRTPKPVEVFTPRHERRSTAAKLGNRALKVRDGLQLSQQPLDAARRDRSTLSGRTASALGVFARAIRAQIKAHDRSARRA